MVITIISVCIAGIFIIPALFCVPRIRNIEAELAKRAIAIPGRVGIEKRIIRTAGKMMLWAITIVLAPVLIRKLMEGIVQQ